MGGTGQVTSLQSDSPWPVLACLAVPWLLSLSFLHESPSQGDSSKAAAGRFGSRRPRLVVVVGNPVYRT
jgi:hypothetical protein